MLELKKYQKSDAPFLLSWLQNERTFRYWCTDTYSDFPPTAQEINAFYTSWGEDIHVFTAMAEEEPIGHITMRRMDKTKAEWRLGFILVDEKKRGKGYGKEMLSLAIRYAFEKLNADAITIGVFEENTAAKALYEKLGFIPTGEVHHYHFFGEEMPYPILKMEKRI